MADTRISALTRLPEAGVSPTDLLPIADLSASETKAITAKDLLEGVVINMDAGSIPASKINFSSGVPSGNISVSQGDVVLGRISGSGFAEELACTAAGRALLAAADAAGQRTALGLGTLALRSGSWVDGSSFSGTSSGTNTGDQTITLTGDVTGTGTGAFAATIAANAVTEAKFATGAVSTRALADDSVTAAKLADQSACIVAAAAPGGAGAFLGQQAIATATGVAYTYTATGWQQHAGVQGVRINEINNTPLSFAVVGTTDSLIEVDLDQQAANTVWAGPTSGSPVNPSFRALVGADLPAATATTRGAVQPGVGVAVTGDVLNVKPATNTVLGGVSVPGPSLAVAADGKLTHAVSPQAAGTFVKVRTDATGHVIEGLTQIGDADVSGISAAKLTTGTLDIARIGANTIERTKLANYATTIIQETDPGVGDYVGQFWYRESDAQLRTWSHNSWIPVGFGRLSQENLRFCGTFDASTGVITNLTTFGVSAGLVANAGIPAASEALTGAYLVAVTPGTYSGEVYDNGDWALCLGVAGGGWVRVDTLSSAGGAATFKLDDLLDVTITSPQSGDSLVFDATTATWKNRTTHGQKVGLLQTFDGLRSSFTTSRPIVSENNLLVSIGGVIQNPGVDFTAVAGTSTLSFSVAPPAGAAYWILQEAAVDGSGGGGGAALPPGTSVEEILAWNNTLGTWLPSDTLSGGTY